jgi:hypothetical protein
LPPCFVGPWERRTPKGRSGRTRPRPSPRRPCWAHVAADQHKGRPHRSNLRLWARHAAPTRRASSALRPLEHALPPTLLCTPLPALHLCCSEPEPSARPVARAAPLISEVRCTLSAPARAARAARAAEPRQNHCDKSALTLARRRAHLRGPRRGRSKLELPTHASSVAPHGGARPLASLSGQTRSRHAMCPRVRASNRSRAPRLRILLQGPALGSLHQELHACKAGASGAGARRMQPSQPPPVCVA